MSWYFQLLSGAAMFGAWICGAHFLKFWFYSKDRLFLLFGISFWIMALERLVLAFLSNPSQEENSFIYLFRLTAFLLILFAIIDKNTKVKGNLQ